MLIGKTVVEVSSELYMGVAGAMGARSQDDIDAAALGAAKDALGIPRSQQPSRQWRVYDPKEVQGTGVRDPNPRNQGIIYEYEIPQAGGGTKKVYIADHNSDTLHGGTGHIHMGVPKPGATSVEPDGRYTEIGELIPYVK